MKRFQLALVIVLMVTALAAAQNYQVKWSVVGIGGGMMDSPSYRLNGTVGQTAAGRMGSPSFLAMIGYWQGEAQVGVQSDPQWSIEGPLETRLFSPAPNPFAGATRIRYTLAREADIRVLVHDRLGRVVRTLVNSTQPAGRYELTWRGTDTGGHELANGIYFCRFETDDELEVSKVIISR